MWQTLCFDSNSEVKFKCHSSKNKNSGIPSSGSTSNSETSGKSPNNYMPHFPYCENEETQIDH